MNDLKEILGPLVKASVLTLSALPQEPLRMRPTYIVSRGGSASIDVAYKPDIELALRLLPSNKMVSQMVKAFLDLASTSSTLLERINLESAPPSKEAEDQIDWVWKTSLMPVVASYIRRATQPRWDESIFDQLFSEINGCLTVPSTVRRIVSPLSRYKAGPVELERGLRIRPATVDEMEEWLNSGPWPRPAMITPLQAILTGAVVEETFEAGAEGAGLESAQNSRDAPLLRTLDLLSVLRLIYGPPLHFWFVQMAVPRLLWERSTIRTSPYQGRGAEAEWMGEANSHALLEYWRASRRGPNARVVGLPLRRWSSAAGRLLYSEQLIDYWIALESLLIPDSRSELSFRAALRGAVLLGDSPEERQHWFDHLRTSYDWRSHLVHGGDEHKPYKGRRLSEVIPDTRRALQLAIQRVLQDAHGFSANTLDSRVFRPPST